MHRRDFMSMGYAAGVAAAGCFASATRVCRAANDDPTFGKLSPDEKARHEPYWRGIADALEIEREPINLIAGANNPSPKVVLERLIEHERYVNPSPLGRSRFETLDPLEEIRTRLAGHVRARPDEVALTRGTTEGANVVINGHPLEPGDEIVTTRHDYGAVKNAIRMRAARDGLGVREVDWKVPVEDPAQIVEAVGRAITPRTKLVVVCHVLDGYWQILPVKEICRVAHGRGAAVLVDGAMGFGHIDVDLDDLGCDYYATSLHKWLGAPLGSGFLYVRQPRIAALRPLYGTPQPAGGDVRKFEIVGTKAISPLIAVGAALDFFEAMGPEVKFARLRYLKRHWTSQLRKDPNFTFLVSPDDRQSGAGVSVEVKGCESRALWIHLLRKHGLNLGIHPYAPDPTLRSGVYVSPNVYTMPTDLDRAVAALQAASREGVPAEP